MPTEPVGDREDCIPGRGMMLLEVGNGDCSPLPGNPDLECFVSQNAASSDGRRFEPPSNSKPDTFRRVLEEIHDFCHGSLRFEEFTYRRRSWRLARRIRTRFSSSMFARSAK